MFGYHHLAHTALRKLNALEEVAVFDGNHLTGTTSRR